MIVGVRGEGDGNESSGSTVALRDATFWRWRGVQGRASSCSARVL